MRSRKPKSVRADGRALSVALLLAAALVPGTPRAQCAKDPGLYRPGSKATFLEQHAVGRFCYYCRIKLSDEHYGNLVYLPLLRPAQDTREPRGALAESFETDPAAGTITFRLRDLAWESGEKITADDVVETFDSLAEPGTCALNAHVEFRNLIREVRKVDDATVVFAFKSVQDAVPDHFFVYPILPRLEIQRNGLTPATPLCVARVAQHMASGPYLVDRYHPQKIVFKSNPDYLGGDCAPYIDFLEMSVVGDRSLWQDYLANNTADMIIDCPLRFVTRLSNDANFEPKVYGFLSCIFVAPNMKTSPHKDLFRNQDFRRALAHAYNRERILNGAFAGKGQVLAGPVGKESRFYNANVAPVPYSVAQANLLVRKAGLRDSDGDRVVEPGGMGEDLRLRLVVSDPHFAEYNQAINFFVDDLADIGVRVEVVRVDPNRIPDVKETGDFDLLWEVWEFDDSILIFDAFTSTSKSNFFGYSSKKVDQVLSNAWMTNDPDLYRTALLSAQAYLAVECPVLFLWDLDRIALVSARIRNLEVSAYNFFEYIDEAYVLD